MSEVPAPEDGSIGWRVVPSPSPQAPRVVASIPVPSVSTWEATNEYTGGWDKNECLSLPLFLSPSLSIPPYLPSPLSKVNV